MEFVDTANPDQVFFNTVSTEQDKDLCAVCLDPVRVPVELTCFPCSHSQTRRHCYSINRICLHCARQYLQLNEPRHERKDTVKCLFCPATINPQTLNAESSYKKDYRMMVADTCDQYRCFHDSRCLFKGTQTELEKHIQGACRYRMCFCQHCHQRYRADTMHDLVCKARFSCRECGDRVLKSEYSTHFLVAHNLVKCVHCFKMYDKDHIKNHEEKGCHFRLITCTVCEDPITRRSMYSHLLAHRTELQNQIKNIDEQIEKESL